MRILSLNMSEFLGGLEMISETYFRELRERGVDISFLLLRDSLLHRRLREEYSDHLLPESYGGKLSPRLIATIRQRVQEGSFDILHVHRSKDIWPASVAVRGLKTKLVYTSYNFLQNTLKRDPLHRVIYGRCDLLTVFSQPQRMGFLRCIPVPDEKVQVIPHGIDIARFNPASVDAFAARSSFGLATEHLVVGVVGRIMPSKGQWILVSIAHRLLERFPHARILYVGADSKGEEDRYFQSFKEDVHKQGLASHILFTGFRSDIPECLAAMDVFVLPSQAENFGTVLLEAMAMERPCLGTNSGGTPEILDGGKAGILFEPESPESLLKALMPVLERNDARKEWGERARKRIEEHYLLEDTMRQWITAYERLLA